MTQRNSSRPSLSARRSAFLTIEAGLFTKLPRLINSLAGGEKIFVITDSNVLRLLGGTLQRGLALAGVDAVFFEVLPGEGSKSAKILSSLHTQLLSHGVGRRSLIVALGGGVVGDVAGFAAATVLRGIRYVHVPTTLVAQVDSSIGGKVGINHRMGKNLIGAFHQPVSILTDPSVLSTLPVGEFRNGLAEVVKIAFAYDPVFFRWLERNAEAIRKGNQTMLVGVVRRSAALKSSIVERDERDEGIRRILNFGHTIGHALEAASGYTISHGMAVSIGMAVESGIAVEMGILRKKDRLRLIHLLRAFGLPLTFPSGWSRSVFSKALRLDKKSSLGIPKFALPGGIGKMIPDVEVRGLSVESLVNGH